MTSLPGSIYSLWCIRSCYFTSWIKLLLLLSGFVAIQQSWYVRHEALNQGASVLHEQKECRIRSCGSSILAPVWTSFGFRKSHRSCGTSQERNDLNLLAIGLEAFCKNKALFRISATVTKWLELWQRVNETIYSQLFVRHMTIQMYKELYMWHNRSIGCQICSNELKMKD